MKNITLSADEKLLVAAQERAQSEHTTLNEQFSRWLLEYTQQQERLVKFDGTVEDLRGKVQVRRKLTRDEMNAR